MKEQQEKGDVFAQGSETGKAVGYII